MATNFDSTITKLNTTQFQVGTSLYDATFDDDGSLINITNTRLSTAKEYASTLGITAVGAKTQDITSLSPLPSPITDAVYSSQIDMYDVTDGLKWTSTAYALVTTDIDAGIAAYPQTNLFQIDNKIEMLDIRTKIDADFAIGDYLSVNDWISKIEFMLGAEPNSITSTSTLANRNTINIDVVPQGLPDNLREQHNNCYNTLTNTFDQAVLIENQFAISGSGGYVLTSDDAYAIPYFNDGVQFFYIYLLGNGIIYESYSAVTVITTIQAQFDMYAANYDKTDSTQQEYYDLMLTAFATIATLNSNPYANYSDINNQISFIKEVLSYTFTPTLKVTSPAKDEIKVEITSTIPNLTYSSQKLVLSNCGDATQEYTLENSFPANYLDVSKILNSNDIIFGSQYADSVYQAYLAWNTDNGQVYSGSGYVPVTTQIDCGIAKIIAQHPTCKVLNNKLNEIMTYRRIIDKSFANEDYNTTIFYIKLCLTLLTKSGCNCGC